MSEQCVTYRVDGHVAIITMARPEVRNAVNGEMARGLELCLDRMETDDQIRVGILAGEGPSFCAGADLHEVADAQNAPRRTERGGFAGIVLRDRAKPLIAAVDGAARGGGFEIVLACDLVVASAVATFGLPEVERSLVPGAGGMVRLALLVPPVVAMEIILTGDPVSAERAYEIGLVNRLAKPGEALATALEMAHRIARNAPLAVRAARRVVHTARSLPEDQLWSLSDEARDFVRTTLDFQEGLRAFFEKRAPVWQGK